MRSHAILLLGALSCLLACKSNDPPPTPVAATSDAPKPAPAALGRQARARILDLFTAYDSSPVTERTTQRLIAAKRSADEVYEAVPPSERDATHAVIGAAFRVRMAPLIDSKARASGDANDTLTPSPNEVECLRLGNKWIDDGEVLESLTTIGYEHLACGKKQWDLRTEAARCYLYWSGSEPDHERGDVVFIWKDMARYQRQLIAGHARGDEANMRYLALVSDGAAVVTPGGAYSIVARGEGWLQIRGTGDRVGQDGVVDDRACHRKKPRGG